MIIIFIISIVLVGYSYIVFPIVLSLFSINKKPNSNTFLKTDDLPFISIIISAFNEEKVIETKIKSIYQTSYPIEKIEILIGSDCSSDNTNNIINELKNEYKQISFFEYSVRRGKANVVNDLVEQAKGEILILTDANVFFENETIFELVKHFKNDEIGLVDTNMQKSNMKVEGISIQETKYINWEVKIKNKEGLIWGSMMGPFGGCFAIKKALYAPVPSTFLVDDFFINMKVFEKNKKAINELNAIVFEDVSNDLKEEIRRKKRIATGNFQNLIHFKKLLFSATPGISFCFISHKVIRWLVPFLIIIAFISNIFLASEFYYFKILLLLQVIIFSLPLFDFLLKKLTIHITILRFSTHFISMNIALMLGFFKFIIGVKSGIWQPTKRNQ